MGRRWTKEQIDWVKHNYSTSTKKDINYFAESIKRTNCAVKNLARNLGLKKTIDTNLNRRYGSLLPLLDNTLVSYYWIGYILADGCITNSGELKVTCSIKDKEHLNKLAVFLDTPLRTEKASRTRISKDEFYYKISVGHQSAAKVLKERIDIKRNKTYNPPDFEKVELKTDEAIALLIGFIDGDGSINLKDSITIGNHSSWICVHRFFQSLLNNVCEDACRHVAIDKNNKSRINIRVRGYLYLLKFINDNKLPVMKRKWFREKTRSGRKWRWKCHL